MEYLIEFIMGISIFIILTEIAFFKYIINIKDMTFAPKKTLAILVGIASTLVIFVLPCMVANNPLIGLGYEEVIGNIFYIWYYGIIVGLLAFFKINHIFYKKFVKEEENEVKN